MTLGQSYFYMKAKSSRISKTLRKHKQRKKYSCYKAGDKVFPIHLETPKTHSSCRCCGNPRKHEKGKDKLTIQEKRATDTDWPID